MKWFRSIALILSIICLLSIIGCKRQSDPMIGSSDVSSATAEIESLISSEEVVPSESQEPVSSELSTASKPEQVTSSQPEPEVSSQPEPSSVAQEPSSVAEEPSSKAECPESDMSTIPFTTRLSMQFEYGNNLIEREDLTVSMSPRPMNQLKAKLIRSGEELAEAGYSAERTRGKLKTYLSQCDDAYFKEYAIVEILIRHFSGSEEDEFHDFTREDHCLTIHYTTSIPTPEGADFIAATDDTEHMLYLLEVKQSDVMGVVEVVGSEVNYWRLSSRA